MPSQHRHDQDQRLRDVGDRTSEPGPDRRRVWVVDDSALERATALRALGGDYDVRTFNDGNTALEQLHAEESLPDVLILDWMLPGISGLELLRFVRSTTDALTLPILMLTAIRAEPADLIEALDAGANDYVTKPYIPETLCARVTGLARIRALHERARLAEHERTEALDLEQRARAEAGARAEFEEQLIGIVSHDLRNPVSTITFTAAAMLRRATLDETDAKSLRRIAAAADRAHRMIRDLLDFTQARLGNGIPIEPAPMDLTQLLPVLIDDVAIAHPSRRIVATHEGDGDGHGRWDSDRIAQVFTNLLNNALAYSPPDEPVTLTTRGERDNVTIEVHNGGGTIAPEMIPRLFAPLQRGAEQVDRTGRSIGLGLYIVDAIVRAHGGSVSVRSTREDGTRFSVRLPRNKL